MSDARLAEIRQRIETAYQPAHFGWRTMLDGMALLAEIERLRAREAALVARHEQAMAVVRETAAMIESEPGVLLTDDDRLPYCPVCNHNDFDATTPDDFRHSANCTVAKARALLASVGSVAATTSERRGRDESNGNICQSDCCRQ